MFYIIFDLVDGDPGKTFIGTLNQCVPYIEYTYGGFGYESDYAIFNITVDYRYCIEKLSYEIFEHHPRVNIYEEVSHLWKICELCKMTNKIGDNRYCIRCLENYNNRFCSGCRVCITTDIENSMWYSEHDEEIYCIDCQTKQ
jgi:hypothetical protein